MPEPYATPEKLQELKDQCVLALEEGDLATAESKATAAQALIAMTPNGALGGQSLEWRADIEQLLLRITRRRMQGQGIRRTPIRHKRPS